MIFMHRFESLQVFFQVVELNSCSRANEQLEISNVTITNRIATLEQHFGVRLLKRTNRKICVTDDGHSCYQRAQLLLGDMTELEDGMQGRRLMPL